MAKRRTTLILDSQAEAAARELARRHGWSLSEAIRRSLISQSDIEGSVPPHIRKERARALKRLFDLFAENDPVEEIRTLKQQDVGF